MNRFKYIFKSPATVIIALSAIILVGSGIAESLLGWLQIFRIYPTRHILYPATGTMYNPGPYCGFLALILPLSLSFALQNKNLIISWFGWMAFILSAGIMPVLGGRIGWLAALFGCALVWWGYRKPVFKPNYRRILLPSLTLIAIIGAVGLYLIKPQSANGRLLIWRDGISALSDHPLYGTGWDNVAGALGNAQEQFFVTHPQSLFGNVAGAPATAFNEYIQIGIAFGLIAALLMLTLFIVAIIIFYRNAFYGFSGTLTAFSIFCIASYPLQFPEFILALSLIFLALIMVIVNRIKSPRSQLLALPLSLLAIAVISAGILISNTLYHRSRDLAQWNINRNIYLNSPLSPSAIADLDSIALQMDWSEKFLFDYGKALRDNGRYELSNKILNRGLLKSSDPMFLNLIGRNWQNLGNTDSAEIYYRRAANRIPSRLYPKYLLALLYSDTLVRDTAAFNRIYDDIISMDIKVQSPATRDMLKRLKTIRNTYNPDYQKTCRPSQ